MILDTSSSRGAGAAAFLRERPVPPEFASRLAQVFPREDGVPWALARWEPGDEWEPIQRWVIWQMVDPTKFDHEMATVLLRELRGPSPRSQGHYCADHWCSCPTIKMRHDGLLVPYKRPGTWVDGIVNIIDYQTWLLYQETGFYGTRAWIVQGARGGHPKRLDSIEKQLALSAGLPEHPPTIGELPYAPLDERVITQLVRRDRLRDAKGRVKHALQTPATLAAEDADRAAQAAAAVFDWLSEQVAEPADIAASAMKRLYGHQILAPHGTPLELIDGDAMRAQFIRDTALVAPSSSHD